MSPETLPVPPALARLEKLALPVGGVFLLACAAGFAFDRGQFLRSWLFAFLFWLGIAVGSLGLAMLNQLTGGLWGAVPRRFHEAAARTIPYMLVVFLPVLLGTASIYPWAGPEAAADELLQKKAAFLNVPFFVFRALLYFAIWTVLAYVLSAWSARQDAGADKARDGRLRGLSGIGLVVLSGTTTFAAIDWGMTLAPHWFSTIYGVLYIVGWTLSALSFTIVLMARVSGEAPFDRALQPVTVHDLGKLLLAFTMLWAYVNFSQFLIVWSGNISEETPFYLRRLQRRVAGDRDPAAPLPLRAAVRSPAVAPAQAQRPRARDGRVADAAHAARRPLLADRARPPRATARPPLPCIFPGSTSRPSPASAACGCTCSRGRPGRAPSCRSESPRCERCSPRPSGRRRTEAK